MAKLHKHHGEFIPLHWEYSDPSSYYVRGHVEPIDFAEAVASYYDADVGLGLVDEHGVEHAWARWIPTPNGDADYVISDVPAKGRGCFAVTVSRVSHKP